MVGTQLQRSARRCRCRPARSCRRTRGRRRRPRRGPSWSTMNIFMCGPSRSRASRSWRSVRGSDRCLRIVRTYSAVEAAQVAAGCTLAEPELRRDPPSSGCGTGCSTSCASRLAARRGRRAASTTQRGRISSSSNPAAVQPRSPVLTLRPRIALALGEVARGLQQRGLLGRRVAQRPAVGEHRDRPQPGVRDDPLLAHQRQHAGQAAVLLERQVAGPEAVRAAQDRRPGAEVVHGRRADGRARMRPSGGRSSGSTSRAPAARGSPWSSEAEYRAAPCRGGTGVVYQIYPRSFAGLRRRRRRRPRRASGSGSTTCGGWAWTRCGSRPSTRRRSPTWATTSPTTRTSTRCSARLRVFDRLLADAHDARSAPAAGPRAVPHLDRARLVPRPSRLVHLGRLGRRAAEQLDVGLRRAGMERDPSTGRWYLHSFYPEQPDLDWHKPEVVEAMQDVVRFWIERGVDGFRLDAIDRLVKDRAAARRPAVRRALRPAAAGARAGPGPVQLAQRARDRPGARGAARGSGRGRAAGRRGLPADRTRRPLPGASRPPVRVRAAARNLGRGRPAACDRPGAPRSAAAPARRRPGCSRTTTSAASRTASGAQHERAAAMLLLTLPGSAFVYQGDEIGMGNGPGANPPRDRVGRDSFRHPMQWDGSAGGGFTHRHPVAAAGRPRRAQRRRSARRPGIAAVLLSRPDRSAAHSAGAVRGGRRHPRRGLVPARRSSCRDQRSGGAALDSRRRGAARDDDRRRPA